MDFVDDDLMMSDHLIEGFGLGPMDGSMWGPEDFDGASDACAACDAAAPEEPAAAQSESDEHEQQQPPLSPQQPLLSPGTASPISSAGSSPSLVGSSPLDPIKEEIKAEPVYMSPATAAAAQAAAEAARAAAAAMAPVSMLPIAATAAPEKKRRGKRKREDDEDTADPAALRVRLPRDTLLRMSSCEVQNYMHQLSESRTLTAPEERELKRLKRLVKNRESAQLSRQRKRDYVDKLEAAIRELSAENHNTKYELSRSRAETEALRENVRRLTRVIEEACAAMPELAETKYPEPTPMPPVVMPVMEEDDQHTPDHEAPTPAPAPQRQPQPQPQPQSQPKPAVQLPQPQPRPVVAFQPFVAVPPAMLPVPHVKLPIPDQVQQILLQQEHQVQQMHQFQHRPPPMARGLKTAGVCALVVLFSFGLFFNAQMNGDRRMAGITFGRHSPRLVTRSATVVPQPQQQQRTIQSAAEPAPSAVIIEKAEALEEMDEQTTALVPVVSSELPTTDLVLSNANIQATLAKSWSPKNISYMMCNNVTRYDPPTGMNGEKEESCVLGFLVPYSSINGSDAKTCVGPEDFVEILCKVIDVNIIPHHAMPLRTN
eukprot:m51a1_g5513 putative basic-leucine zipper transcription factor (599) ;mRNA; r:391788-394181